MPTSLPLPAAFGIQLAQSEVDFVVPDLATDLPICIDPFLLFKSRDASLRQFHEQLVGLFTFAFELHGRGDRETLDRLISFPEVNEIGFGYSNAAIRGSGLGWHLSQLLIDLLEASEEVRIRGLRHIEELQLLSVGVGPDRVSDIAANVLKLHLIDYTRAQAELWGIPLTAAVPVRHYFDSEDMEWRDGYFDLPLNPLSQQPILLVPRRMVRLLPWINYGDFYASEARLLLPPRPRMPRHPGMTKQTRHAIAKGELVDRVRMNTSVLDQYVSRKENAAQHAVPILQDPDLGELRATGTSLAERLDTTASGTADAAGYQRLVYEILNFAFEPDLTAGEMEVATHLGTERRDIVYWNEAEHSFWRYVRTEYHSPLVMFECKNTPELTNEHVNQVATYLGARLGMLGLIVTRNPPSEAVTRKAYSVYNDSPALPRKIILIVSDELLRRLIAAKSNGQAATPVIQELYRQFRQAVQ